MVQLAIHHSCQNLNFLFMSVQKQRTVEPSIYTNSNHPPGTTPQSTPKIEDFFNQVQVSLLLSHNAVHFSKLKNIEKCSSPNLFIVPPV